MTEKYLGNVLESFSAGAQSDLRFRLAVELMKAHSPHQLPRSESADRLTLGDFSVQSPVEYATFWLETARSLVDQCTELGLLMAMPEDDSLSAPMRAHLRRAARANVYQQIASQEIAQDEQKPALQRAAALPLNGPGKLS